MRLTLVSTATPDRPGSMRRYAELVQAALGSLPEGARPEVSLAQLASPAGALPRLPRCFANRAHHLRCALRVRAAVRETRPDLVHILDGSHAYLANLLPRTVPFVATVHDLIPLLTACGELNGPLPSVFARFLWRWNLCGLRKASRTVADSGSTRADLHRLGGISLDRITVLHLPLPPERGSRTPCGDSPPAILHVGHNSAYKNRDGVLRVAALVSREVQIRLVMAGPPASRELLRLAAELGITALVDWHNDVTDAELQDLYRAAAVFLFPSRYEGFGWPPLEAMAAGAPVVCANAASLPEVVGEAALLAAPDDHAGLARHCVDLLTKPDLAAEYVRRGHENTKRFSLDRFAAQLVEFYAAALAAR